MAASKPASSGRFSSASRRSALSDAERALVWAQLEEPVDLEAIVAAATTPERAAEIYTAALLAIEVDTPAERGWLDMLAARLDLPADLVVAIHREMESLPLPGPRPAVTDPPRVAV